MPDVTLLLGDCLESLKSLPDECVDGAVTSPPYYQKLDYGQGDDQLGLEPTPELYCERLAERFREVYRVMKNGATLWIVINDTYNNTCPIRKSLSERKSYENVPYRQRRKLNPHYREKELMGVPFLLKDYLREIGFIWRSLNIWHKPNAAYDSAKDRPTINHEYVFQFLKAKGRGRPYASFDRLEGSVWSINPEGQEGHPCVYPVELASLIISHIRGEVILDPFMGSGATMEACLKAGKGFIGVEIDPGFYTIAQERLARLQPAKA